ncbi:TonB-dependent receptor [Aureispira anguillae]|uniref:TonB-dependent receptor n=1 Tax=Aureispira anguillae TaxID=2864201 RepID=A0A915Y9T4_9BACT|nr:TonB-dependent receptor [Aureispira anguillae]BDS09374.1 TonB-dependent receptor [Aureispira anguillae]
MKKLLLIRLVALIAIFIPNISFAQTIITGKIVDHQTQEPLIGVNLWITSSEKGTITNTNGEFSLEAQKTDEVQISFIGYESQQIKASEIPTVLNLKPTVAELSKVIISASRNQQSRAEAPAAIASVTATSIDDARATSLDQLLNKTPGVFMVDLGNEQHSMSIRQPLSFKSLFLYLEDGLPIRPTGVFNHNALLEMNQANIRHIEVIRGPSSSLYGSEAIGGAINFITLRPTSVPTASIRLQGNNLGYKRVDLRAAATFGNLGVAFSGYYANRRNGFREHSDLDKLALTLKLTYKVSEKDFLSADATIIDYKSDMTGSLDSASFYGRKYTSLHTFTQRDVWALRSKIQYKRYWTPKAKTSAVVFFRDNSIQQIPSYRVKDDWSPWGNPTGDKNLAHGESNNNSYKSFGALIQHRQEFDFLKTSVTAGASIDYSPNSYQSNYISITKSDEGIYTNYINETDSMLTDYKVGLVNPAAYVQVEMTPFRNFKFVAAARYDAFVYNYDNNLPTTAFSGAPDNVDQFWALTPKIGATYTIAKTSGIYANFSQGFVPPQIGELYRGVSVPILKPATYNNFELGGWMSLLKDKLHIDLSLYLMDGFNEILSVRQDNGTYMNQNAGKTRHMGIEYGVYYSPIKDISIRVTGSNASHTFLEYNEKGTDYAGNLMPQAPNWLFNTEVMYKPRFLKGFRIGVEMMHMNQYYMDAANTKMYDGFVIFNGRVGYTIKGFDIWCNVMNFTNQLYSPNARLSKWGESITVGNPINVNVGIGYNFVAGMYRKK